MPERVEDVFRGNCFDGVAKGLDEEVYSFRAKTFDEGFDFGKQMLYWVEVRRVRR